MKSFMAKPLEIERKWYVIDADGKPLGRLASEVASILRGKRKPIYTPNVDTGDFVIIVNAEKVLFTGKKFDKKLYRHHTGHPGGLKEVTARQLMAKKPEQPLRLAIKGMLPKNSLGRQMITKLKIYAGPEHGHQAQQPQVLDI